MKFAKWKGPRIRTFVDKLNQWQFIALFGLPYSVVCAVVYLALLRMVNVHPSTEAKIGTAVLFGIYAVVWSHGMWETKEDNRE